MTFGQKTADRLQVHHQRRKQPRYGAFVYVTAQRRLLLARYHRSQRTSSEHKMAATILVVLMCAARARTGGAASPRSAKGHFLEPAREAENSDIRQLGLGSVCSSDGKQCTLTCFGNAACKEVTLSACPAGVGTSCILICTGEATCSNLILSTSRNVSKGILALLSANY